jgi:hypothetical protein
MSTIPALGARTQPASLYSTTSRNDGKTDAAAALQKTKGTSASPVSLSGGGLDLQKRVASVGNATVDFAQDFVGSFTQALFGDAAKGAVIDFDSASLEASSSYALGVQHSEGANGTTDAAAFQLSDSSHFIGKGTITTADGRKFDFEVEVQYNYDLTAAASQTTDQASQPAPAKADDKAAAGTKDLPTVQLPNIDFPGTLADLFKLIGVDLQSALSSNDGSNSQTSDGINRNTLRSLSLRLLNLVDSKDANTYADLNGADKAKSAYDAQAAAEKPADVTTPVPAPAAQPADAAKDAAPAQKASA